MNRPGGSPPATFVLFTGHNDRAVVALARFLTQHQLPWLAVASGAQDALHRTAYAPHARVNRLGPQLDVDWLLALARDLGQPLAYCPTTEFINQVMLEHREALEAGGWQLGLPSAAIYSTLTNKATSPALMHWLCGITPPQTLNWYSAQAPCVLKPRRNLQQGQVHYPQLCLTPEQLSLARRGREPSHWFAQAYIEGQSHYLCAYIGRSGLAADRAWFWQENLLQQPDGKSIVWARTGANPGLAVEPLLAALAAQGYHGPLMMEVLADATGHLHFIEINPRFWGPLQLTLDACPDILRLFAADHGHRITPQAATSADAQYAWAKGALHHSDCKAYPKLTAALPPAAWPDELIRHDVYGHPDTRALHLTH